MYTLNNTFPKHINVNRLTYDTPVSTAVKHQNRSDFEESMKLCV